MEEEPIKSATIPEFELISISEYPESVKLGPYVFKRQGLNIWSEVKTAPIGAKYKAKFKPYVSIPEDLNIIGEFKALVVYKSKLSKALRDVVEYWFHRMYKLESIEQSEKPNLILEHSLENSKSEIPVDELSCEIEDAIVINTTEDEINQA